MSTCQPPHSFSEDLGSWVIWSSNGLNSKIKLTTTQGVVKTLSFFSMDLIQYTMRKLSPLRILSFNCRSRVSIKSLKRSLQEMVEERGHFSTEILRLPIIIFRYPTWFLSLIYFNSSWLREILEEKYSWGVEVAAVFTEGRSLVASCVVLRTSSARVIASFWPWSSEDWVTFCYSWEVTFCFGFSWVEVLTSWPLFRKTSCSMSKSIYVWLKSWLLESKDYSSGCCPSTSSFSYSINVSSTTIVGFSIVTSLMTYLTMPR